MTYSTHRMNCERLEELSGRISSLDGLRAVSVFLVIFTHASISCGFPSTPEWITWLFNGEVGVRTFFVISGFIITLLLLKEEDALGSFSIGRFYVRRALRILPVYYLFLAAVGILQSVFSLGVKQSEFVAALTFTTGWWSGGTWLLGHTWSLSVEEQFYLLWPLILLFVRNSTTRCLVIVAVLAIFPLLRVLVYMSSLSGLRSHLIITQGDSIIWGSLLAVLLFYKGEAVRFAFIQNILALRLLAFSLIAGLTAIQSLGLAGWFTVPLANTLESLAIAWLVGSFIFHRDCVFAFLNCRLLVFFGMISYSWYLWQQLFLFECQRYFSAAWFSFPINVVLSLLVAIASYYIIERSCERLKKRVQAGLIGSSP